MLDQPGQQPIPDLRITGGKGGVLICVRMNISYDQPLRGVGRKQPPFWPRSSLWGRQWSVPCGTICPPFSTLYDQLLQANVPPLLRGALSGQGGASAAWW